MIVYMDCTGLMQELLRECRAPAALRVHLGDPDPQELPALLAEAVVAINGHTTMDAALIAGCPKLRDIVFLGTGASSYIDIAAADAAGVRVHACKGYGDRSIAEHAFALALSAARQVVRMDRDLRDGRWEPLEGLELAGRCFGVIGAGGIGMETARIAKAFGMRVLIWNRSPLGAELSACAAPLERLLAEADVVSLHLAETSETRGFAGREFFAAMKNGAIFVNTARGRLVDDAALVEALAHGRIGHAALDVFAVEPLPAGSPYLRVPNVTLTSHAAFKTRDASRRLLEWGIATAEGQLGLASVTKRGRPP